MMLHAHQDELALVEASRGGNRDSFTQLVTRHQGQLRAYVGGYIRDKVMVDDLCQEAFLHAFRDLMGWRQDGPFIVWLMGIARHRVLDYLRSEQRLRALRAQGDQVEAVLASLRAKSGEGDAPALIERERQMNALRDCVGRLPPHSADLLQRYYFGAQTAQKIAEEAGRGASSVRMMLLRIREALRECIQTSMLEESK